MSWCLETGNAAVLGWPKGSFMFFHSIVQKNPNELSGQPKVVVEVWFSNLEKEKNSMSYWLVDIFSIKVPITLQLPWSRFLNIMLWIWCGFGQWNQIYQPQALNDLVFFLVWNYQVISQCQSLFSLDNMLRVAQVRLNVIVIYHHCLRYYHHWLWRCKEKSPISPCRV